MRTPTARPASVPRRAVAALVDLGAVGLGMMVLWWLDVGRLRWPDSPYDWLDELGTLAGEHVERLGPPLLAWLSLTTLWQLGGRLMGQGTSPGERVMGLALLDRWGRRPHPLRVFGRVICGALTALPVGWWVAIIDPGRQTFADRATGVRLVTRASLSGPAGR